MSTAPVMKRTVRVTIEKEIEIELTPALFGSMSVEEYLEEFRKGLFEVEGLDNVFKYAAEMAAHYGAGSSHDGLGRIAEAGFADAGKAGVIFTKSYEDTQSELLPLAAAAPAEVTHG